MRHPSTGDLHINFDQSVFQLLKEAVHLQRMGLDIPPLAMRLVERHEAIVTNYNNVKVCYHSAPWTYVYTCTHTYRVLSTHTVSSLVFIKHMYEFVRMLFV